MNQFKQLCQSGAYSILEIEMDKLLESFKLEYDPDPYQLSFNHGEREGAEQYCQDLKDLIEGCAKKS